MPRKSTKVVNDVASISTSQVDPAPCLKSDTKKRAPVKRVNQKKDALSPPTIPLVDETTPLPQPQPQPIQVTDNVNTFNIHINHVSEDGNSIENTFSTSYSHTNGNSTNGINSSRSSSDNNSDTDEDSDCDYDAKFKNSSPSSSSSLSSLSLPASVSAAIHSLFASTASMVSEDENPLYTIQQINYDILIPFVLINMHASSRENIMALLHTTLISCIEGRCITEGFIKPRSTRIIDFKCGKIIAKNVQFNIVIECLVCNPRAQSIISCVAKNITQAGIRAISDDEYSPIVVYITRDFGVDSDKTYYNSIKEGDKINIKVIGKRFEMNDKHIQIIGFLVHPKKERISVATPLQSKKSVVGVNASHSPTTTTEAKEEPVATTSATKRAPRKTKNALSITNDTDNNVITITYDADIDLPKAPKAPKKSKKESAGAALTNE